MAVDPALLITSIVGRLKTVQGIAAIVLGGSRARGTHTEDSDIDLGIYYDPAAPLDLGALSEVAAALDDEHRRDLITGLGGWGPWINGGGWLHVAGLPVDFLYRDLDKVARVIADCRQGRIETVYQPGHPFAFLSSIYVAEIASCVPLSDPHGTLANLKTQVIPYPPDLKQAILRSFWWEVDFSLSIARKAIPRGDVTYASGCCFRAVNCLLQVLFAINEQYWMNEKGALALADRFAKSPVQLQERVEEAFTHLHSATPSIAAAIALLHEIARACEKWVSPAESQDGSL